MARPTPWPQSSRRTEKPRRRTSASTARPNVAGAPAGDGVPDTLFEGRPGAGREAEGFRSRRRHGDRPRRIGHESVQVGGQVDLHQVARTDRPLPGDAVYGLLVEADADRSGNP
jgi:hypothetical protein